MVIEDSKQIRLARKGAETLREHSGLVGGGIGADYKTNRVREGRMWRRLHAETKVGGLAEALIRGCKTNCVNDVLLAE